MLRDKLLPVCENMMLAQLNNIVDDIREKKLSYVVWGAGNTGRITCEYIDKYSDNNCKPQYIVDNNKMFWGNGRVKSPADFEAEMDNIDVVLVCVYVSDQVVEQLRVMGYSGRVMTVSASVFDVDMECINHYDKHIDDIEKIYAKVEDEKSRRTIETYLNVIRTGDIGLWEGVNNNSRDKLLDPEIIEYSSNEHFVDIGAFTGDTLERFLAYTDKQYASILCIEPDVSNYEQVLEKINSWNLHDAFAMNAAAGAEKGVLRFRGDVSESCTLSDSGDKLVDVETLDDVEKARSVTLLKVSTNGFDLNALKGAENIIKQNKPKIATYISGDQLWTVPQYILTIMPEYKLYVRHYGIGRQAMILYAIV